MSGTWKADSGECGKRRGLLPSGSVDEDAEQLGDLPALRSFRSHSASSATQEAQESTYSWLLPSPASDACMPTSNTGNKETKKSPKKKKKSTKARGGGGGEPTSGLRCTPREEAVEGGPGRCEGHAIYLPLTVDASPPLPDSRTAESSAHTGRAPELPQAAQVATHPHPNVSNPPRLSASNPTLSPVLATPPSTPPCGATHVFLAPGP